MSELPMREVTDPRMLRAMAHPLRLSLLNKLVVDGQATATELAEALGESPANCSWHLRQLAKYGLIEEAGGGTGRNRPWRWVPTGTQWGGPDSSPELSRAGDELSGALLGFELAKRKQWQESRHTESTQWRDAAFTSQAIAWLTAEELSEINREMGRLAMSRAERLTDPSSRPEGARAVRFVAWAFPSDS